MYGTSKVLPQILDVIIVFQIQVGFGIFYTLFTEHLHKSSREYGADAFVKVFGVNTHKAKVYDTWLTLCFKEAQQHSWSNMSAGRPQGLYDTGEAHSEAHHPVVLVEYDRHITQIDDELETIYHLLLHCIGKGDGTVEFIVRFVDKVEQPVRIAVDEILHIPGRAYMKLVTLHHKLAQLLDVAVVFFWNSKLALVPVHFFCVSVGLDKLLVIRIVVLLFERRVLCETINQQALPLQVREAQGTVSGVHTSLNSPGLDSLEKSVGNFLVVN